MYTLNKNYFEKIDTEKKAYFLGLFYADGCICRRFSKTGRLKSMTFEITLSLEDRYLLEYFLKDIEGNYPIKIKSVKYQGDLFQYVRLAITNSYFCRQLISLGCVPQKSAILEFPSNDIVPEYLVSHFIRGYFDGNGCVSCGELPNRIPSRDGKYYYRAGFCGSKNMIESIETILVKNASINKIKHFNNGKAISAMWGGRNNVVHIYNYIYKDATIYMSRKYQKFQKYIA